MASGFAKQLGMAAVVACVLVPASSQAQQGEAAPAVTGGDVRPDGSDPAVGAADERGRARDARALAARRLLHAAGGGVLRVEARLRDGAWECRRDGQWQRLPAGLVVADRLEADVVKEAAARRAAARRGGPAAEADVAAFMLDEGLLTEGMAALDALLERDPGQRDALRVLQARGGLFALPEAGERGAAAFELAERSPAALRALLAERVWEASDRDGVRAEIGEQLGQRAAGRRALAARALRCRPRDAAPLTESELQELLRRVVVDRDAAVRAEAAASLSAVGEPALVWPVVRALTSTHPGVRCQAVEALGAMGYAAAVAPLEEYAAARKPSGGGWAGPRASVFSGRQLAFVQGFDVEVAQGAAIGDPESGVLQEGATLDVRVLGTSSSPWSFARETAAIRTALNRLTGQLR